MFLLHLRRSFHSTTPHLTTTLSTSPTVTLITSNRCGLCRGAKYIVKKVERRGVPQFVYNEVDISQHPELRPLYREHIPIVMVNDVEISRHKLTEKQLLDALQAASAPPPNTTATYMENDITNTTVVA